MDLKQIRKNSIESAEKLGVNILSTLPLLDSGATIRNTEEIISRILAMSAVAACAYGFDKVKAIAWLKKEKGNIIDSLSEQEKLFMFEDGENLDHFKLQIEGIWALVWAMGIVNEFDFKKEADPQLVMMLPNLKQNQSSGDFRKKVKPLSLDKIIKAFDLAYCLHWAVRQSEINRQPSPINLKSYIVSERRRALEWLLSRGSWDQVQLDT